MVNVSATSFWKTPTDELIMLFPRSGTRFIGLGNGKAVSAPDRYVIANIALQRDQLSRA